MTTIKSHEYQWDINQLLSRDETGLVSSFVLQLDSILSQMSTVSTTELKILDETIKFLYDITSEVDNTLSY